MRTAFLIAAALALAFVALVAFGSARWRRATDVLVARLQADARPSAVTHFDAKELDGLPAPVQRYFRRALHDGATIVRSARLEHEGEFNLGTDRDLWKPFASIQQVRAAPPGFVWHARNFVLPGIAVQVHDAYVDHEGLLHAALLGLWTVAQVRGGGDFARDELMRWLAEAAWVPTALLPSQGVRWEAIDEHRARATLRDGAIEATLDFEFGADDLIAAVRAPARGRMVDDRRIPTTWEGRWSRYEQRGGMWIPITGEVAWLLPEGRKAYWRGTLTAADYDSVPAAR
ncbi:MAG: hypothetical protein KGL78_03840 [Burkholderiales bacterium]|nr:hypothetical protein [Burkholderiales bacterium]